MHEDLVVAGFHLKDIDLETEEPMNPAQEGLHINPLEFLAGVIGLWILLKEIIDQGPRMGGYVIGQISDNTTITKIRTFQTCTAKYDMLTQYR